MKEQRGELSREDRWQKGRETGNIRFHVESFDEPNTLTRDLFFSHKIFALDSFIGFIGFIRCFAFLTKLENAK